MRKPTFAHSDYEIVKRDIPYQGIIFRIASYQLRHRLFNGGWSDTFKMEVAERLSAAAVLPYDPLLDHVILIEQFRPGSLADPESPWLIEIPAGVLAGSETPEELARREAVEEANCNILAIEPICGYFPSPGASNEYLSLYCGKVDASHINGVHGLKHEHEDIRVINVPTDEAVDMLEAGLIKTSPAITSLLWLQIHRNRLQELWHGSHTK